MKKGNLSLNPCFNGRYSRRKQKHYTMKKGNLSLNPCFNGRYSRSPKKVTKKDALAMS